MTGTFLDVYTLRARVFPALLALVPALVLAGAVTHWENIGVPEAVGTLGFAVVLFALADIARRQGRKVEQEVFAGLGGKPSMTLLRHRDAMLDGSAKARMHMFLGPAVGCPMPTVEDEATRPHECDNVYEQCGAWLRENTRDAKRFKILKDENITYGFRRNLLGLKRTALVVGLSSLGVSGWLLWPGRWPGVVDDHMLALVGAAVVSLLQVGYFTLYVTEEGVREAARQYGRQLLLCCEILRG